MTIEYPNREPVRFSEEAVRAFPIKGPVDEAFVHDYMKWRQETKGHILDHWHRIEDSARLRAIRKAGLWEYLRELQRPIREANRAALIKEYEEWHASEDYQWLRNYFLEHTDGSVEEIEAVIASVRSSDLNDPKRTREQYANWLWRTRHYFGLTHNLGTVLEMGAMAQRVEKEMREGSAKEAPDS